MTSSFTLERKSDGLRLHLGDGGSAFLSWRWLRDHGEDESSLDPTTRQRRIDALGAEPTAATEAWLDEHCERLVLTWPELPHRTWITTATLRDVTVEVPCDAAVSWHRAADLELNIGDVDAVLESDQALAGWLGDIALFGVGMLRGFDGTHDQAERLARRIGYPRSTIFGSLWDLASDIADHDDTAYGEGFLAPHTDGTYVHDAPGLQMFCCSHRSGTGGESIIVDGRAIAEQLAADRPDLFAVLTSTPVPGHYIEPGVELRASRPAIIIDQTTGRFCQISLNNYDRSPMLLPGDEMASFYEAYGALASLANDESRWLDIRLEPGDVLINDNWRVLHGRHAHTGERRFIGCYLNHEDFESRCRVLGLR